MKKITKKLFGGLNLTWKKIIIASIIVAIYTAIVASIHVLLYTSFHTINATLEVWILFGIIIIMNSKSNLDSALKCFVFFLISQPLIYLFQVPFSWQGWGLFKYYPFWGIITVFCLPMGYIGYYLKKDKWWSLLILLPMILLVALSYSQYLSEFIFNYPFYILIVLFCIATMVIYPLVLLKGKKIKIIGLSISIILIIGITIITFLNPPVYNTNLPSSYFNNIDNIEKIYLEDSKYGKLKIVYNKNIDDNLINATFKKAGKTKIIVKNKDGKTEKYSITIKRSTYDIEKEK